MRLAILSQVLRIGDHVLGNLWTDQLSQPAAQDLHEVNTVLLGLNAQYRAAQPNERAQFSVMADPQLMEGTTINFPRSLVPLAWILQHAVTLLPMASDIQAVLNSQTPELVTSIRGDLCCHRARESVQSHTILSLQSNTQTSADSSTAPGNWAVPN